jgi:hypothetical protein
MKKSRREFFDELDRKVSEWHASEDARPIHEFLGLTFQEYNAYVRGEEVLWELLNSES